MDWVKLSEAVGIKTISENSKEGVFEIEGLYDGYGITLGNALRRTLLSSLTGAVITQVKIKGVNHEFSTLPGAIEDIVEICLNLKKIRFKFFAAEPQILSLKVKGEKEVTAADIKTNSEVQIITPEIHIATLSAKSAELDMELTVEKGLGYVPVEARKLEKLPIGTIALDALFSPVIAVNFVVENMRVGDRTDYNRLRIEIRTDGSIAPSAALHKATNIMKDHFEEISKLEVKKETPAEASKEEVKEKKASKKKTK